MIASRSLKRDYKSVGKTKVCLENELKSLASIIKDWDIEDGENISLNIAVKGKEASKSIVSVMVTVSSSEDE